MWRFRRTGFCWIVVVILLMSLMVSGCGRSATAQKNSYVLSETDQASGFAAYKAVPVTVKPINASYQVARDLSNVSNRERVILSPEAKLLLVKNGFVVVPDTNPEFFQVYEGNRYNYVPDFITTDAMLHNYHLFFDYLLKNVEKQKLIPELKRLNSLMLAESVRQYEELKGTKWENPALRNMAFFAVAGQLMDHSFKVPAAVNKPVAQELDLIAKHDRIEISPIMAMGSTTDIYSSFKEDYTQYIPRGHYTKSEDLKKYFKTMMWYGRLTFRAKSEDETRSAVLITLALSRSGNLAQWEKIYEPTTFFVGKADDVGYYQFRDVLMDVYGSKISLAQIQADNKKWQETRDRIKKLDPPAINSIPIFNKRYNPDREKEIQGFRFMGQRFTLDASVFQRLVYREVEINDQGKQRMLPKGLDIPAAMGSEEAYAILNDMGETKYKNYPENMEEMQKYIKGLGADAWHQNLYWNWLYTLLPLTGSAPAGYPSFMRNGAWERKQLNTYLANWTELKHDTILYAKQVYAEMGGGGDMEIPDDRGYVEPNPELYGRLAAMSAMTRQGLMDRKLLTGRDAESLERIEELSLSLKKISEKELTNTRLTNAEYDLIRSFGGQLEHFWLEALRDDGVNNTAQLYDNPAPLVADVATDPNGSVLEEGTGFISQIYAVVPVEGKLRIARGAAYSYYEFPQPMDQRLTDAKWQEMLRNNEAPPAPVWTKAFTATGENRFKSLGED